MQLCSLAILVQLASTPSGPVLAEDPEPSQEIEKESAELDELRALEEVSLDPSAQREVEQLQALRLLGFGNPLRQRMHCSFEELDVPEDEPPPELAPVTDLASFDISQVKDRYDIPVEMQPLVAQYLHFFQGPGRKWYRRWLSRSTRYLPLMQAILAERGLPRDTVYLAMIESGFSAQAYSWAHAAGPWQFIPSTGRLFGLKQDFWVDERRDPLKSTHAAARYLSQLHRELGDWYLAWAGYNAGGGRLRRLVESRGTSDFWELSEGRGLAKETKHYVPKLIAAALIAKHPKAFGFAEEELDYQPLFEFEEVKLEQATDLEAIARAAEVEPAEITSLNPELKRWCTPPASAQRPYLVRVPKGSGERAAQRLARLGPSERLAFRVHKVSRGDTLSAIAARYHSAPEAIMRMNGLRSARALRVNAELVVPVPSGQARAGRADPALERQVARARGAGLLALRPEEEVPAGTQLKAPAHGSVKRELVEGKTRVTYGVQSGDTLWGIAQRFNCSVEDLRKWNRLPRGKRSLRAGMSLTLWPAAPPAKASARGSAG